MRCCKLLISTSLALGLIPCGQLAYGQASSTGAGSGSTVRAAHTYPNKPIRIVTAEVAAGADVVARMIAQGLTGRLAQQVVVENRGGSIVIPVERVVKATPDGHTVLLHGSTVWLLPFLQSNAPYDPVRDFAPVTLVASSPNILVVQPALPVTSVKDLIALAKARSDGLNYGSSTAGSSSHLAGALFNSMAGVNIQWIPFKGTGPAMAEMIGGGQVHVMFPNATGVMPHIKSGRLKSLAVTSAKPSALAPGLPTVASAGLPGYEAETVYEILAPALTPAVIVNQLNREVVGILTGLDFREKFGNAGLEVVASTPQQLAAIIRSDMVKMGKVIREAGIRAD